MDDPFIYSKLQENKTKDIYNSPSTNTLCSLQKWLSSQIRVPILNSCLTGLIHDWHTRVVDGEDQRPCSQGDTPVQSNKRGP